MQHGGNGVPSPSTHLQEQRWHGAERSPKPPRPQKRSKDPNRVKSRPADPAVIGAILDSFEALHAPIGGVESADYGRLSPESSVRGRSRNRADTDESLASGPSVPFVFTSAPSLVTPKRGRSAARGDEDEDNAALPPIIPTTRSPSVHSLQSQANGSLRPTSIASRRSSTISMQQDSLGVNRKLSAESWIKHSIQHSVGTAQAMRNLGRIDSQESLRNVTGASIMGWDDIRLGSVPGLARGRDRLYLEEDDDGSDTSTGQSAPVSPNGREVKKELPVRVKKDIPRRPALAVHVSPKASLIADSVPLRTSSLRQPSSVPPKVKKSPTPVKRNDTDHSTSANKATEIPDTSWADLGEDDSTVKRIMELRKKRETRLLESDADLMAENLDFMPTSAPVSPTSRLEAEILTPGYRTRPGPDRSRTEPAPKARAMLGISPDTNRPLLTPTQSRNVSASPELIRTSPPKRAMSAVDRPGSAASATSPIALEFSYLHAVSAMQRNEQDSISPLQNARTSIDTNGKPSMSLQRRSLIVKRSASQTEGSPYTRPISRGRTSTSQNRWTTVLHPDVPLDFAKKRDRRKSMTDAARNGRAGPDASESQHRRDSVEDAVMDYLDAPRFNQQLVHSPSRRIISFSEVGDPEGSAVFICVGMGLTRYVTAFYDELATTLRLRLITLERPGVGGSSPHPPGDRSGPLNWSDDLLTVCEHLHIEHFSLLAHSAGAVYALATALTLPDMIQGKVHLLAPWIPPSQLAILSSSKDTTTSSGALPRSQRFLRVLPTPLLRAVNSSFMNAASLQPADKRKSAETSSYASPTRSKRNSISVSSAERPDLLSRRESLMLLDNFNATSNPMSSFLLKPSDPLEPPTRRSSSIMLTATATPTDPEFSFASTGLNAAEHAERERQAEFTSRLTQRTWEFAIKDSNPATDLLVCLERNREVGFRYTDVSAAVVITHGAEDKRVPVGNVRRLGAEMNKSRLAGAVARAVAGNGDGWGRERGCEVRVLNGEGHGLMASPIIMGDVLTEIAGYWRESSNSVMEW
ncbi:hypothetical protein B0A48_02947 [Cryoendolithus antarcticus]|uniref:AB hydrolase-1 domain-containing protein n=1 Tax=Cryoendolithus antarcticus TaxID=1507870 RepID=A0A1V8TLQ2_9PEZI|nr:hypothetical protein B0A48_02947 [Cryoendolithus antarcticus]